MGALFCLITITPKQLEQVIGKVKTGKYGSRIIELMRSHVEDAGAGNAAAAAVDANKRRSKDKDVIRVESSDEG
jgi:ATP-dependent DNA helicase Q1